MSKTFCCLPCDGSCRYRTPDGSCVYEYNPDHYDPKHQWKGEGDPPRRWRADDGTIVYRSFSDYCD